MMQRFNISRLPPASKKKAWSMIQRDFPALAQWMHTPAFEALRDELGAEVVVRIRRGRIIPIRIRKNA